MSRETLRVALLGCSRGPGEKHLQMWQAGEGAQVVLLAERAVELANQLAREHNIARVCHDFREAAVDTDIDIVDIALPPRLHAEASVLALGAGHHVLCEKPMSPTLEEADRIVAAVTGSDRVFGVHFQSRFTPIYDRITQLIEEGAIGRPVQWRYVMADGSKDRAENTGYEGILQDCGIHNVDRASVVFGRPVRVQAIGMKLSHRPNLGEVDTGTLVVTYEDGDQMSVQMCNGLLRGITGAESFEVLGPEGIIQYQPMANRVWSDNSKFTWTDRQRTTHTVHIEEDWRDWGRNSLGQHFVDCVRDPNKDRNPLCGAEQGRAMVLMNRAVENSLNTGNAVDIEAFSRELVDA